MSDVQAHDERLRPIIDAALHRYFAQLTRRYTPVLIGIAVLALVVFGLPSKPEDASLATTSPGVSGPTTPGQQGQVPGRQGTEPGGTGSPVPGGGAGASDRASGSAAPGGGDPRDPIEGSAGGVARSGVECAPGALQVTWSPYAPPCLAAWSGDNGGATSRGVTAEEITVVIRTTTDMETYLAAQGTPPFEQRVADAQTLIDFFNANYELYGRRVVLRSFNGQGNQLSEINGGGQAGAQADAQTAQDMGAFAGITGGFGGFVPYAEALAERGIIFIGTPYTSSTVYEHYSPYIYGTPRWMMGRDWGRATAATVCDRMNGMPAVFAGDPAYQRTTRVFGMTTINNPGFAEGGDVFQQTVGDRCGASVRRAEYSPDTTSAPQQALQIVAQMKANGVTTLVHAGDPLMYATLTQAAAQQNWHPEFIGVDPTASFGRLADPEEMAGAFVVTPFSSSPGDGPDSEAGRVYRLASGGSPPRAAGFGFAENYLGVLQLFNALQAAGPNLTPDTFLEGMRSRLPDASGEFGLWRPSAAYSLPGDFVVARWNPSVTNSGDGKAGDFIACDSGARYPLNPQSMGSGQLGC